MGAKEEKEYLESLEKRKLQETLDEVEREIPDTAQLGKLPPNQMAQFIAGILSEPMVVEVILRVGKNIRVKTRTTGKGSLLSEAAVKEKKEGHILVEIIECPKCGVRGLQHLGRIPRKCSKHDPAEPMAIIGRVWWDPVAYPPNTQSGADWIKSLKFEVA